MKRDELAKIVERAKCKIVGWEDACNDGHRLVLATVIRAFDNTESALLCEPSLARKTNRPPDVVLIDPEIGVHVFEVKGIPLDQIEALEAGGSLRIRYASGFRSRNPVSQVRSAMFDIKDATVRAFGDEVRLPFRYWVVFPAISRNSWAGRFGPNAFCPPEFLFADNLDPHRLARRLGASDRGGSGNPITLCPLEQLECVWRAFGDTSVLYASPEDRQQRIAAEGTLGEQFDETAEAFKTLPEEQQRLSAMNWESGPRLIRGVAGSGKTIVLANNIARRLERMLVAASEGLFGPQADRPKLLAVCFNRTLAPFIEKKIHIAFQQRTGRSVPQGMIEVVSFNTLMWRLANAGLWPYQNVKDAADIVRAMRYLNDMSQFRQRDPARMQALAYDAIYVDEGQDFLEEEFRLLKDLCRVKDRSEPSLFVFYDDAQNLYGRGRPNWQSLGLNMRGRSFVMTQCFRNTRPILEATFNVLYGSCASRPGQAPTREFGDIGMLEQKALIARDGGFWRVRFASREGLPPRLSVTSNAEQETEMLVSRLRWLIIEQEVRPEDIQLLSFFRTRVEAIAEAVAKANIPGIQAMHVAFGEREKDQRLGQKGRLTLSTVASAKGYDAFCVLLASANEFPTDVIGRANFYVGCTRAIEYLEVFAYEKKGLAAETEAVLGRAD